MVAVFDVVDRLIGRGDVEVQKSSVPFVRDE